MPVMYAGLNGTSDILEQSGSMGYVYNNPAWNTVDWVGFYDMVSTSGLLLTGFLCSATWTRYFHSAVRLKARKWTGWPVFP